MSTSVTPIDVLASAASHLADLPWPVIIAAASAVVTSVNVRISWMIFRHGLLQRNGERCMQLLGRLRKIARKAGRGRLNTSTLESLEALADDCELLAKGWPRMREPLNDVARAAGRAVAAGVHPDSVGFGIAIHKLDQRIDDAQEALNALGYK
jgi:hypothetical protein